MINNLDKLSKHIRTSAHKHDAERMNELLKPYNKTAHNIITCTIDENGDVIFLATDANDAFLNHGDVVTTRASHVEPVQLVARICFYILRWFGDKGRIAEWTRNWHVTWRVNTRPVGGPILRVKDVSPSPCAPWMDDQIAFWYNRQEAIDAEIKFLNEWFLERGIQ